MKIKSVYADSWIAHENCRIYTKIVAICYNFSMLEKLDKTQKECLASKFGSKEIDGPTLIVIFFRPAFWNQTAISFK